MSAAASSAETGGAGRSVIAALGVVQILTWGSSFYLLTVLAGPISRDTGWPLQWIVGSLSVGLLVAGLVSPKVGALIDARGGRPVLAGGCALLACGLALLALAPGPAMFMLGWCIAGAGMAASLYDAAFAALGRLYGAGARRAITMLTLWGGFASTVCWPITAFLDAHLGWRATCLVYAGLHLFVSIPLVLAFMPAIAPRAETGRPARGGPVVLGGPERISFLLMAGIVTLIGTIASAMSVQVLALLQSRGLSLAEAVAAGAFIGPAQVFARIIEQASGGRHHPLWTMIWAVALMGLGLVLLAAGFPIVAVALVAYGAGNGIFSISKGTVPLAVLGAERYPILAGRLARPALLAQALAPLGAAQLLTAGGAGAVLSALIALWLGAAVLLALLWRQV
ncbi:MFS transporter [Xanthobacter sp. 91]|uniref:MFS transporter n=1 Tax=Xanthobacter sp. 91 TaxID=1117244 RepID=UPI000690F7EF|nr:MFS transporter [Xanthobacter sp. 91]